MESTQEPQLADLAIRLLRALKWHGPAQVEFRVDPKEGRFTLIEVNGRFWGTVGAAVRAGVNFPVPACQLALEGDVEPVFEYRIGQRYRFPVPFGVLAMMEAGSRWTAFRDFFASVRGTHSDWDWRDPAPLLAELRSIGRRVWRRMRGNRRK